MAVIRIEAIFQVVEITEYRLYAEAKGSTAFIIPSDVIKSSGIEYLKVL